MKRSHLSLTALALSTLLTACGNPPPATPPAPTAEPVASPAPAAPNPTPPANNQGIEQCFATANVKRAKFSGEPAKITVKHVLVKFKGSKNAADTITRTRAEACLRAIEARDKVRSGEDFEAVVKAYSEEAGAATRGGSIGAVERKDLAKPFADAAFELSINQMSDIVETEFGFHVIFRSQ